MTQQHSIKGRVFRAGGWTIAGYGASQILRFGSNLILTRLLFPEAFGLMSIVQAVLGAVVMISDIGVAQSIVRSTRGAEPNFINTAWTIQVARGAVTALALLVLAKPISVAYHQPQLALLIAAVSLVALITGFNSTNIALANRNVDASRLTLIDIGSLAAGLLVSVLLAWHDPSPWALVWGNVLTVFIKMWMGHTFLPGPPNRFFWDKTVLGEIFSFGAWVMLSSALTYLGGEGNRLITAALLNIRLLALLGLATTLNVVLWQAVQRVSGQVLFPAYSEVLRTNPSRFSAAVQRARIVQVAPAWCLALVFAFFGPGIVHLLYDHRYADAGVILQILAVGSMVNMLNGSFAGVLWAMGKVSLATALLVVLVILQISGMTVGYWVYGQGGAIIGFSAAGWLLYPPHALLYAKAGLWHPKIDIPVLLASTVAAVGVFLTMDWTVVASWH